MTRTKPTKTEKVAELMRHRHRGMMLGWTADYLEGLSLGEISDRNDAVRTRSFALKTYRALMALVFDAMEEADPDRVVLPYLLRRPKVFYQTLALWHKGFTMHDILTLPRSELHNQFRRLGWGTITIIRSLVGAASARAA